jgi:hypothetical protein
MESMIVNFQSKRFTPRTLVLPAGAKNPMPNGLTFELSDAYKQGLFLLMNPLLEHIRTYKDQLINDWADTFEELSPAYQKNRI